jgi:hypothetical protein
MTVVPTGSKTLRWNKANCAMVWQNAGNETAMLRLAIPDARQCVGRMTEGMPKRRSFCCQGLHKSLFLP